MTLAPADRHALSAALAAFEAEHPELAPQIAVWSVLAEGPMARELAASADFVAAMGPLARSIIAEMVVTEIAMGWARALARAPRRGARGCPRSAPGSRRGPASP